MKPLFFLAAIMLSISLSFAQSKKDLEQRINQLSSEQTTLLQEISSLKDQILLLTQENSNLKVENEKLKSQLNAQNENTKLGISGSTQKSYTPPTLEGNGRCQATTQAGSQCSRKADAGSNYCWQHKATYEPTKQYMTNPSNSSSGSSSGRTIYTGPRGGRYYINSSGKKVYVK